MCVREDVCYGGGVREGGRGGVGEGAMNCRYKHHGLPGVAGLP